MIITKKGNALDVKSGIIVHGCNSHGVMGSGIALEVKTRFPGAFFIYRELYNNAISDGKDGLELGTISVHKVDYNPDFNKDSKLIVNAITQKDFGRTPGAVYVSYPGLREAFKKVNELALTYGITTVNFPLIGCGLAQGDWKVVSAIIDEELDDSLEKVLWEFTP